MSGQIAKIAVIARIAKIERREHREITHFGLKLCVMGDKTMKYARSFLRILLATLREIFDENAYQRFLQRTGQAASVQSYRQFQRERESGMATRPRCC